MMEEDQAVHIRIFCWHEIVFLYFADRASRYNFW